MKNSMDLKEEIKWEINVRLPHRSDRQQFNTLIDGKWKIEVDLVNCKLQFEVSCRNNWDFYEAYNKANKWLLNQFDWPNFEILSIYCPESNKGWKNFKLDCESYSK